MTRWSLNTSRRRFPAFETILTWRPLDRGLEGSIPPSKKSPRTSAPIRHRLSSPIVMDPLYPRMLCRRRDYLACGGGDEELSGNMISWDFQIRLMSRGRKAVVIPRILCLTHCQKGFSSPINWKRYQWEYERILQKSPAVFEKSGFEMISYALLNGNRSCWSLGASPASRGYAPSRIMSRIQKWWRQYRCGEMGLKIRRETARVFYRLGR